MTLRIDSVPRPDWSPLPYEGCRNVDGKVLLDEERVGMALLRFGPHGTVHEHPGDTDAYVVCLEGRGFTSVANEQAGISAGQKAFWPKHVSHRLWTDDSQMLALIVHPHGFQP